MQSLSCPLCRSKEISVAFTTSDRMVTNQPFDICSCHRCGVFFTHPIPDEKQIWTYYDHEGYISHTDTSRGQLATIYRFVRRFTMGWKRRMVEKKTGLDKGSILDFGCGTGTFLSEMRQADWHTVGIEPNENARTFAVEQRGLDVFDQDRFDRFADRSFDAVTLWHVLEHVHRFDRVMKNIRRVVKPGGKIFFAVPNPESCDAQFYKKDWAALDVPRHLYHFTTASMEYHLGVKKMKIVEKQRMPLDPFYISLLSEKRIENGGSQIRGIWIGVFSTVKSLFDLQQSSSIIYVAEPVES